MPSFGKWGLITLAAAASTAYIIGQTNAGGRPVHDEAARLARWKPVTMQQPAGLSARERQLVETLTSACRQIDEIYWRQSDLGGYELYRKTQDATIRTLLGIMAGRWDLIGGNRAFVGEARMPPGHELYPHDLTRAQIDQYLASHPEDRAAIYSPNTVVKWRDGRLVGVPFQEEYQQVLAPIARTLREAAALSPDRAFANFLRLRAGALLSGYYYASEVAWLNLKDPKFDLILAPYEADIDGLLGVKLAYTGAVLIRNEPESRRLAMFQQHVPEIQQALPVDAAAKPSKHGHLTPMEVMDAPYRGGDLGHGYQAVADNLPDDPRVHAEKGTKKILFKNFMDARVNEVVLPIARALLAPGDAEKATAEGYLTIVVMHEISHDLGPDFAHVNGKQADIRESIGPVYGALEEAKADVTGMFGLKWLVDRGALPKGRLAEYYASYVAGIFRTLRFGTAESHGRAELMEFNYLREQNALGFQNGRYIIDYARMPSALEALTRELLDTEAAGDRARAEAWFAKYATPLDLRSVAGIPVDVFPRPLTPGPRPPVAEPKTPDPGPPVGAELLRDYKIPAANIVKFGDVDGDGKPDFLVITPDYSAYMYNNQGRELWHWAAPAENARLRGEFEAPGSLWDFDQDGRDEVIHWRFIDGKEWLVMADGLTGAVKRKVEWPTRPLPHVYNNFRIAIAKFHPGYADNLLVFTDYGGVINITAYDRNLNQIWQHSEKRAKDFFGHYIYPVDLNGDGIDEVVVSHLCLDARGNTLWNNYRYFDDNHDHMDSIEFLDLDGDGKPELITGQSDVGALAYNARTGEMLWHNMADHTQQIAAGNVLKGMKTPQVIASGRVYRPRGEGGLGAQLYWFDNRGRLLSKWPDKPITGNPDFVRGDWYGDGRKEFFWHKYKLEEDGRGTEYFDEPVYHMFDFLGNGAEQVITLDRTTLRVYGYRGVKAKTVKRDSEYKRNSIANHTHY